MIRSAKINVYMKLMKSRGIDPEDLLANTNIDSEELANPEGMVSRESYYNVIMNMLALNKDPAIAFSLGEFIDVSAFGILGYAMLSSTTLGQVVRIRSQCQDDRFGTPIRIDSAVSNNPGFELSISSTCLTETLRRFETEEFLSEGLKLMEIMTGVTPVIRSIAFAFSKPSYSVTYSAFFKCPIEFDAPRTVFRVRVPDFDTLIPNGNVELHKVCAQHCRQVMQSTPVSSTLRDHLRELFLARPAVLPDLQMASAHLGMSERNLRRKLEAEGLTFQSLKDQFRLDLSRQWLISGRLAPKEVAHLLGYTTPSAFSRAFKSWTGMTVRQVTHAKSAGARSVLQGHGTVA